MELSVKDTKMMQGLSVMAMVWLHLFDRYDYEGLFTPLLFWKDIPLSFYFGQLSDFCVMGFAFCSGYAHFVNYKKFGYYKRRLVKTLSLYCNLWIILIVFTIISMLKGCYSYMPGNLLEWILNMVGVDCTYNGAWWYIFVYALIVIVSPFVLKTFDKVTGISMLIGLVIYLIAWYIRFESGTGNVILLLIGKFGMTYFEYLLGAAFCKFKIMSKVGAFRDKMPNFMWMIFSTGVFLAMLVGHTLIIGNVVIAPITGAIILILFHMWRKPLYIKNSFLFIGRHSTNIWLTHMFFYAKLFPDFVYIAQYPLLIFMLMMAITIGVSCCVNWIYQPVDRWLSDKFINNL